MKNWPLLLCLSFSSSSYAEKQPLDLKLDPSSLYREAEKESSWMQDENYQLPAARLARECREMREQIEALKGKPQRRFAIQQRYEAECLK